MSLPKPVCPVCGSSKVIPWVHSRGCLSDNLLLLLGSCLLLPVVVLFAKWSLRDRRCGSCGFEWTQ